jgi:hypothetical protein
MRTLRWCIATAAGIVAALALLALAAPAGASTVSVNAAQNPGAASAASCLARPVAAEYDSDYYVGNCTGHDEPELDPVSSASHSAINITWHVQLPADGTHLVSDVGPTFWFGGTVKDSNPIKLGGEGFLELQFYPDSITSKCTAGGGFSVHEQIDTYTACSPVWTLEQQGQNITEPAAFNGMLTNQAGTGPFVMTARDVVDVHIWAPTRGQAYREQVTDLTTGTQSAVLVLNSPTDGPLTPAFDTQDIGNALDWGGVYDTPMSFVYEIGHAAIYGPTPFRFCKPGDTGCDSFNGASWAGMLPLRIMGATFGDGSSPQHWAVVSDTGGRAEVLGRSFVGSTTCNGYGGPYCIYPWFTWDGSAFNFGVRYPNTVNNFGAATQFAPRTRCPAVSVFPGFNTYCDTVIQ